MTFAASPSPTVAGNSAQIGDEHRSLIELGRLRSAVVRRRLALLGRGGHLLVQLFDLRLVAERGDHLGEGAAEDSDFVAAIDGRMDGVVAAGNRLRDAGQLLDRMRQTAWRSATTR